MNQGRATKLKRMLRFSSIKQQGPLIFIIGRLLVNKLLSHLRSWTNKPFLPRKITNRCLEHLLCTRADQQHGLMKGETCNLLSFMHAPSPSCGLMLRIISKHLGNVFERVGCPEPLVLPLKGVPYSGGYYFAADELPSALCVKSPYQALALCLTKRCKVRHDIGVHKQAPVVYNFLGQ